MGTYSNAPAVNGEVSGIATADGSGNISGTLFTTAANSYALVNIYSAYSGTVTITLDARTIFSGSAAINPAIQITMGPEQILSVSGTGGVTGQVITATGVQLTNQA